MLTDRSLSMLMLMLLRIMVLWCSVGVVGAVMVFWCFWRKVNFRSVEALEKALEKQRGVDTIAKYRNKGD